MPRSACVSRRASFAARSRASRVPASRRSLRSTRRKRPDRLPSLRSPCTAAAPGFSTRRARRDTAPPARRPRSPTRSPQRQASDGAFATSGAQASAWLPGPLSRIHASARARSCALCHRSSGFLARQTSTANWKLRGVCGCRFDHRHRILREDRRDHARIAVMRERALARGHLVKDHAEREDVGAGISVAAFELLRRHVAQRAQNRVRTGEVGRLGRFSPRPATHPSWPTPSRARSRGASCPTP